MTRGTASALLFVPLVSLVPLVVSAGSCIDYPDVQDRGILSIALQMSPETIGDLRSSTSTDAHLPARARIAGETYRVTVETAGAYTLKRFKRNLNLRFLGRPWERVWSYRLAATTLDPSMLRTPLAFDVFRRHGLSTSKVTPVALSVNDRYWGLYYLIEKVDEDFFARRGSACSGLYAARGYASFDEDMSAKIDKRFESKLEPENLAEILRLAELVALSSDEQFARRIFAHLDRADALRYLTAGVITDHHDGFDKNLFYYSTSLGAPLRLVPWDLEKTWMRPPGSSSRVWKQNVLFERLYAIDDFRREVDARVAAARSGEDSAPAFASRLDATKTAIREAYAEDPALGGMAGRNLDALAEALRSAYSAWMERLEQHGIP